PFLHVMLGRAGSSRALVVVTMLLAGLVAACAAIAGGVQIRAAVSFQTIAHRSSAGGNGPKKPTAFVALKASEVDGFGRFLMPVDARRVRNTDFATNGVVAAFAGLRPSSGYSITIRRLAMAQRTLRIVVELRRPSPETPVLPAFSIPYHVVKVPRQAL